jgi:hypothetical protein
MDSRPPQQRPASAGSGTTQDDIEVVRVQPKKVAHVDEASENTLHRALNANQVCIVVYHIILVTHAISTFTKVTMITLGGTVDPRSVLVPCAGN